MITKRHPPCPRRPCGPGRWRWPCPTRAPSTAGAVSPPGRGLLGADLHGLVLLRVSLYRDARLVDGFPARPIPFEARKPGICSISPAISPSIWGTTGTSTPPPGRAATGW
ncbi:hypothetical protein M5E87_13680 [Flavonifractor plautii]|nr:hypothetical protein M5E87_13680 [Flavonifractor plautii]